MQTRSARGRRAASARSALSSGHAVRGIGGATVLRGRARIPGAGAGNWIIKCDVCGILAPVTAAGLPDGPHTARLACSRTIGDITADHLNRIDFLVDNPCDGAARPRSRVQQLQLGADCLVREFDEPKPPRPAVDSSGGPPGADFGYLDASLNNYCRQVARF